MNPPDVFIAECYGRLAANPERPTARKLARISHLGSLLHRLADATSEMSACEEDSVQGSGVHVMHLMGLVRHGKRGGTSATIRTIPGTADM